MGNFWGGEIRYYDDGEGKLVKEMDLKTRMKNAQRFCADYVDRKDTILQFTEEEKSERILDEFVIVSQTNILESLPLDEIFFRTGNKFKEENYEKESEKCYKMGLSVTIKDVQKVKLLNELGSMYKKRGKTEKSLSYFHRSLKICQEFNDVDGEYTVSMNIAQVLDDQKKYSKALTYYLRSMEIQKTKESSFQSKFTTACALGRVYDILEKFDEAYKYFIAALEYTREGKLDKSNEGAILSSLGLVLWNQKKYEESLLYYRLSLRVSRELGFDEGVASNLLNLGLLNEAVDNYRESLECYAKAKRLYTQLNYADYLSDLNDHMNRVERRYINCEDLEKKGK